MKSLKLFIILSFIFVNTYAQNLQLILDENFDDNKNSWEVADNDDATSELMSGYYYIRNKSTDYSYRFWISVPDVPADKDFTVECKLRQVYGTDNSGYGLFFMSDGTDNNMNFEITSDGYFRTSNQTDGEYDDNDWTKTTYINPKGQYNTLKIKKTKDYVYYYVNDKLLNALRYKNTMGDDFGFILRDQMKVQVDYIKISGFKKQINVVANPITNPKENLGSGINTKYTELIPVLAPDGKTVYFVRDNFPGNVGATDIDHNDIWYSTFDGTKWSTAKNIGKPLNNTGHNFVIAVTPDNNTLILNGTYTAFGEEGGNGLSMSTKNADGTWSIPKTIKIENFYNDDAYQNFAFTTDLRVIVMGIERSDDTKGKSDLYVSFKKSDGTYSTPKNLGSVINTAEEEGTPFIAADGKTLYFYSEGHAGYGSADIFMSQRLDDTWTNWSEPLNLGPNINTKSWDAYFALDAKGEYAFLVSSANSVGEEDIFRVKIQEELQPDPVVLVYGKVYDQKTNKPLGSEISYDDLTANKKFDIATSNPQTGEYKIILPYGKKYGFYAKKIGYMALSDNLDLTTIKEYTEIERNLYLVPIEINQQIILNNVFFATGKADILSTSYSELDRLVQILKDNPEIKIEVQGHTNNIGDRDKLITLSQQRADAVKNYIVGKGIAQTRITTKGFGPDKPIANNATPEGRQKNQRVEFKITDK